MEGIHNGVQYLGRKREFEERKGNDQRIRKGISTRYQRRGMARMRGNNVQTRRIARKFHGEDVVWMVG